MNDLTPAAFLFYLTLMFFGFAAMAGIEQVVKWWRSR